jgi:DNA-binding transcriptional LysR family regulator
MEILGQLSVEINNLAIMYAPQQRPGLKVELLLEEKLVLVRCGGENGSSDFSDYVYVDWGSDFTAQHNLSFPDLANPGLFVGLGPLGLDYILAAGGSGYFRLSAVRPHLAAKRLHLVPKAPEFSHHTYAVYSSTTDEALIQSALEGMRAVAGQREA